MKKASIISDRSPAKLQTKGLAQVQKPGKSTSSALVSDIGIVKKGISKKDNLQSGQVNGNGNSNDMKSSGVDDGINPSLQLEDSFEKYYNKDLDLEEDQVPVVINELNESALNFISQEQYEKALILLQKAQTMLDQIQAEKIPCDQFIFLLTLHNMAMCYQKLGILEECSICLEACIDHLDSEYLQKYFNNPEQPSLKLKMLKYRCKTHMQICALLSQIHKHKDAVFHSNQAIQISHYLINESKNQCEFYIEQLTKNNNSQKLGMNSGVSSQGEKQNQSVISDSRFSLLEKTSIKLLPIFIEIQKKMAIEDYRTFEEGGNYITGPVKLAKNGRGNISPSRKGNVAPPGAGESWNKPPQTYSSTQPGPNSYNCGSSNMKNILGYLNQSEWIFSLNIGNIMQISPLTLQDFLSQTAIQLELSREFVLEKMCFLAVSYFCMGTEYRFLHQLKEKIQEQTFERKDSEYWHGKAVEMAISFLPSESPLVSHILMSYEKHHSPSNMVIPENETQDKYVRIVRQTPGIDSCRLQPIIRHHPDGDYRVSKVDWQCLDWHKIFRTDEYLKNQKSTNKKQNFPIQNLTLQKKQLNHNNHANIIVNTGVNGQINNFNMNTFTTQRDSDLKNNQQKNIHQAFLDQAVPKQEVMIRNKNYDENRSGSSDSDKEKQKLAKQQLSDDDELAENDGERLMMHKTPSQDIFYKSGRMQSGDNFNKNRSEERTSSKIAMNPALHAHHHSQSMNSERNNSINDNNPSASAMPPAFDKKILQQHRNSADSEFNNKGHRKLRPAQKSLNVGNNLSQSQISGKMLSSDQSKNKMLLTECLIEGVVKGEAPERLSSNSLDEIEFHKTQDVEIDVRFSSNKQDIANGISSASQGQRRAKSSVGMNRKVSDKIKDQQKNQNSNLNPIKVKKNSNPQNNGAILQQHREKNSSSAMAQLQPIGQEMTEKIPIDIDQEDNIDEIDLIQQNNGYFQNHQSQPLQVLTSDNQLMIQKPRGGLSQIQMQTGTQKKNQPQAQNQNQQKRFKTNPQILGQVDTEQSADIQNRFSFEMGGKQEEYSNNSNQNGPSNTTSNNQLLQNTSLQSQTNQTNSQSQFMGKRNNQITQQATAPTSAGVNASRKKQANTINVEELQGAAQPTGNVQPQTTTTIISGNPINNLNPQRMNNQQVGSQNNQQIIGQVRNIPKDISNQRNIQPPIILGNINQNQGQFQPPNQIGNSVQAIGTGNGSNGFVAATANIDQSSKNTINVYQFGSGVNFNLKLAPPQNGQNVNNVQNQNLQNQNVSRKQYEQIQNALNQMNSLDRQERHNSSLDEKNFDSGILSSTGNGSVGLKNQINQSQSNKQYQTSQNLNITQQPQNSQNFNQMLIPSASSKRQKVQGQQQPASSSIQQQQQNNQNLNLTSAQLQQTLNNSQRRKNNSQNQTKNAGFNFPQAQFQINQPNSLNPNSNMINNTFIQDALTHTSQSNILSSKAEIVQIIKKRDKLNNSAMANIESGSSSRKYPQPNGNTQQQNIQVTSQSNSQAWNQQSQNNQNQAKIYSKQLQDVQQQQNIPEGSSRSQQKTRRQLSNTDKSINWNNQNLNTTGASNNSNSAQLQGGSRKQNNGGTLGGRKNSLDQKFSHGNGFVSQHHRQFSDISQQNLMGYKGIGSNLGIPAMIGESGPSGVSLQKNLIGANQLISQPGMNEHASMPIMSTSLGSRFITGQGTTANSGQLQNGQSIMGGPSTDMLTQIPSFIQRQQQQNLGKYQGGVGATSANQFQQPPVNPQSAGLNVQGQINNQQKKAQAYLQNQSRRQDKQ